MAYDLKLLVRVLIAGILVWLSRVRIDRQVCAV